MLVCAQLASSSPPESRIPCLENGATHSGYLPTSINVIKMTPPLATQRPIFWGF